MLLDNFNFIYIIDNLNLNNDIYKKIDKKKYLKLDSKNYDVSVNSKILSKIPRTNEVRKNQEEVRKILLFIDILLNAKKNNHKKIIILNNDLFIPEFIFEEMKTPQDWNFLFINKEANAEREIDILLSYNCLDIFGLNEVIYDDLIKYLNTFKNNSIDIINEVILKRKKAFLLSNLFANIDLKDIKVLKKIIGNSEIKICFSLNNDLNNSILNNLSVKKDNDILPWNFNEEALLKRLFSLFFKNNKIIDADSAYLPYVQFLKRNFKNIKFFTIKDSNDSMLNYLNNIESYNEGYPSFLEKKEELIERYISLYKDMENILKYKNIAFEEITIDDLKDFR